MVHEKLIFGKMSHHLSDTHLGKNIPGRSSNMNKGIKARNGFKKYYWIVKRIHQSKGSKIITNLFLV